MKINMAEIVRMTMWATLKGFEEVEPGTGIDTVVLRGGGSGYGRVEFDENYEIILRPDASFVVCWSDEFGSFKIDGDGRDELESALDRIDDLREEEDDDEDV